MDIQTAINNVINHIDLNREDMNSVMQIIMQGNATSAQIGGLLVALRIKGETVDEITGNWRSTCDTFGWRYCPKKSVQRVGIFKRTPLS